MNSFSNTFPILAVYWNILFFLVPAFFVIAYIWILPVFAVYIGKYFVKRDLLHPKLLLATVTIAYLTSCISYPLSSLGSPNNAVQSQLQLIPNGIFAFSDKVLLMSSQILLVVLLVRFTHLLYQKTGLRLPRALIVLAMCCVLGVFVTNWNIISPWLSILLSIISVGFLIYITFSSMESFIGRIHIFASFFFFIFATSLFTTFLIFGSLENNYHFCIGITCEMGQKNITFISDKMSANDLYNTHKHPISKACSDWEADEKLLPYTVDTKMRYSFDFDKRMTCLRGKTPYDSAILLVQSESTKSQATQHKVIWFPFGYQSSYSMQTTPIYTADIEHIAGQLQMNSTMFHYYPTFDMYGQKVPQILLFASHQDGVIRTEVRVVSTLTLDREPYISLYARSFKSTPDPAFLNALRPLLEADEHVQAAVLAQKRILDGIVLKPLELDESLTTPLLPRYVLSPHAECEVARELRHCVAAHVLRPLNYKSFLPSGMHWKLRDPADIWIMGQTDRYLFDQAQDTIVHKSSRGESGDDHFEELLQPFLKTPKGDRIFMFDIYGSHGSSTYYAIVYADKRNSEVYAIPRTYRLRCDLEVDQNKSCNDFAASISSHLLNQDMISDSYFATQFPDFKSLLSTSL